MADSRTREQHMADVAAAALTNFADIIHLSQTLTAQITILENRGAHITEDLSVIRGAAPNFIKARECLRDIASTLPIRGIDFGVADGEPL